MVQVKDLKDQIGMTTPRPFLYCDICGNECSANAGDYWNFAKDYKFICCGESMKLVIKHTVYEEIA